MIYYTGRNGQLGFELSRLLSRQGISSRGFDIEDWDICDTDVSRKILSNKPDILIHAAAYTAVDKAESDTDTAKNVNTIVPGELAKICKSLGIYLIYISTDFVFGEMSASHL